MNLISCHVEYYYYPKEEKKESYVMAKAAEGDTIEIMSGEHKGKKGTVLIVRENSVIVDWS